MQLNVHIFPNWLKIISNFKNSQAITYNITGIKEVKLSVIHLFSEH